MRGELVTRPGWCTLRGFCLVIVIAATLGACAGIPSFDADQHFKEEVAARLKPEQVEGLEIPYRISPEIEEHILGRVNPGSRPKVQVEQILDIIFGQVGLQYSLNPTRNAIDTWAVGKGNCLSFVHLFVGIARSKRLNPSYVEVEDYHRWSYEAGTVISRGHIVAGLLIEGKLETFDFLPYRAKSYRAFKPIDDMTAIAHHYNNLGAEALLDGDLASADKHLQLAHSLDSEFVKASNNLGVLYLRQHRLEEARDLFESARMLEAEDVPILNNLARTYQRLGNREKTREILAVLDEVDDANPFFYLYKGNLALHEGDFEKALFNMRRALRLDAEIPELHVGLAKLFLAQGDFERAEHHVERALKLDATHVEARKYAALISRGGATPAATGNNSL